MVRDVVASLGLAVCVAFGVSGCGGKEPATPADAKPAAVAPSEGAKPADSAGDGAKPSDGAGPVDNAQAPAAAAGDAKAPAEGDAAAAAEGAGEGAAAGEAAPSKPGLLPEPPSLKLKGGDGDDFTLGGGSGAAGKPKPTLLDTSLGGE